MVPIQRITYYSGQWVKETRERVGDGVVVVGGGGDNPDMAVYRINAHPEGGSAEPPP